LAELADRVAGAAVSGCMDKAIGEVTGAQIPHA
jgi:hypothetical protein